MSQPFNGYVFISYSRRDAEVMQRIVTFLRDKGIRIWLDNERLIPGTPVWEEEIEKAIFGASAVMAILSPDAKGSEWVRREITLTEQHGKRIFPVLVRGTEASSITIRLITRQYVDLRQNEEVGLNSLSATLLFYLEELAAQEQKQEDEPADTPTAQLRRENLEQAARFEAEKAELERRLKAAQERSERVPIETTKPETVVTPSLAPNREPDLRHRQRGKEDIPRTVSANQSSATPSTNRIYLVIMIVLGILVIAAIVNAVQNGRRNTTAATQAAQLARDATQTAQVEGTRTASAHSPSTQTAIADASNTLTARLAATANAQGDTFQDITAAVDKAGDAPLFLVADLNSLLLINMSTQEIIWRKDSDQSFFCVTALPNGNIIACEGYELVEIDTSGTVVNRLPGYGCGGIDVLDNGFMLAFTCDPNQQNGDISLVEVDWSGNINWSLGGFWAPYEADRIASTGNTLVVDGTGIVNEYGPTGEIVWTVALPQFATSAIRLPKSETLVGELQAIELVDSAGGIQTLYRGCCQIRSLHQLSNGDYLFGDKTVLRAISPSGELTWEMRGFGDIYDLTPYP